MVQQQVIKGTFFLMQHLEEHFEEDEAKRSRILRQIEQVTFPLMSDLKLRGRVPEFELEKPLPGQTAVYLRHAKGREPLLTIGS